MTQPGPAGPAPVEPAPAEPAPVEPGPVEPGAVTRPGPAEPRTGRHARAPLPPGHYVRALARRVRAQAPLTAVLVVVAIAFWRIGLQHWREGTTLLGVALLLGAGLRATVTERVAGLLAVRPWRVDVLTYAVSGVVVVLLSLTITGGPLATR